MKIWTSIERTLLLKKRYYGISPASSAPQRQVIKQFSNTELLNLVQNSVSNRPSLLGGKGDILEYRAHDNALKSSGSQSAANKFLPCASQLVSGRSRKRKQKPTASTECSPFQVKLQRNPYGNFMCEHCSQLKWLRKAQAQALSTPPRLCLLTGVRLPSSFLIPFGVASHPRTKAPWHLPRLPKRAKASDAATLTPLSPSPSKLDPNPTMSPLVRTATGTHFIATHEALSHISNLAKPAYRRLLPYRWKEDPCLKIPDIVWREDMASFVLEMLRGSAVRNLTYLASRPAAYVAACSSYGDISLHKQIAAILWFGSDKDEERGPPVYAMHQFKDYFVPYFNFVTLLDHKNVRILRETCPHHFTGRIAVIKAKRPTMQLQLELWKLQGFLASCAKQRGTEKAST